MTHIPFLAVGAVAVTTHVIGSRLGYYRVHGFDHLTHFLSGAGVMLGCLWLFPWWLAWLAFTGLVVGWEVFEYTYREPRKLWVSMRNMVHDFAFGYLGALVAFVLFP